MTQPTLDPNFGQPGFKKQAECEISTWTNKLFSANLLRLHQPWKTHPIRTRMAIPIQPGETQIVPSKTQLQVKTLTEEFSFNWFCYKSHFIQPIIHDQQHLTVFKELGLLFKPSYINEAWWINNTILEESVSNYLTSVHPSTSQPLLDSRLCLKMCRLTKYLS